MKTRDRRRKSSIGKTRWAAYAAAGAATALGGSHSLEAAIHYGHINVTFPPDEFKESFFPLDQQGDSLAFKHRTFGGFAGFTMGSGSRPCEPSYYCAFFRGYSYFVSKLRFGENISEGTFTRRNISYFGKMATSLDNGQWQDAGVGFIGFKFQTSAGVHYGWVRVKMAGPDRNNAFKVLDYAYADPGEPIFAGQRSSDEKPFEQPADTDQGSLGGLALGALGLLAWRKSRSLTACHIKRPDSLSAG